MIEFFRSQLQFQDAELLEMQGTQFPDRLFFRDLCIPIFINIYQCRLYAAKLREEVGELTNGKDRFCRTIVGEDQLARKRSLPGQ